MACSVAELWMSCYWSSLKGMYIYCWSKLAQRNLPACYVRIEHHIRIWTILAGPIGPAVNEGLGVKRSVLSRQIVMDLPAL
jgi:hypothetical protein